ncbi:hypothetical protein ACHHYP_03834 [Achlya hypogyna]|uniref:RING-type domain-containing protein n=1 Tax=Achlya hypogyna TaxID=1202772 RepID=A0A1V9Z2T3_ACHHY|nr:hypothetical protein ACHHYP_03834 [Achlya hypogyna]
MTNELIVNITITSARVRGCYNEFSYTEPFTAYSVHITWGSTKWMLQKRYSEFDLVYRPLRKNLRPRLWAASSKVAPVVQAFLSTPFPKKHLRLDTEAIATERRAGLALFMQNLVALRWHLRQYGPVALFDLVDAFLEVPKYGQIEEVRYFDECSPPQHSRATTELADDNDVCSICLCYFNDATDSTSVTLPCKHAFHEACVFSWLHLRQSCPICRQLVVYQSTAALCT